MSKYFIVAALAITGFFFNHTPVVEAAIPAGGVELQGFAWSAYTNPVTGGREGVGWISMNCLSGGACGTIPYGVSVESDGNLTGYAWSSVGYINFDPDLTGVPTASGTARATNPASYPNLSFTGWARACAVYAIGCSGALKPPSALGGWDGWISLDGSSPAYGVEMTSTGATPSSYAWGGPVVMGWIDFSPDASATGVTITPVTYVVSAPDVTITAPTTLNQLMGSFDIEFDPLGSGHAPDSCTVSDGSTTAPITLNTPVTATERVTVSLNADTTYTVECTNAGGSGSDSISINVLYDLVVGGVSVVPGPLTAAGDEYSTVEVRFNVSGVPVGITNIEYDVSLGSFSTTNLEFNSTDSMPIIATFNNVPYGASIPYTVEVDMRTSYPPSGEIPETDEENDVNGTTDLLVAPDPVITFNVPEIVATNTEVPVDIEITGTPEVYNCTVSGPGLPATFNSQAGVSLVANYLETTNPLTNATTIAVRCTIPTGGEFTESVTIEVIPGFQEV